MLSGKEFFKHLLLRGIRTVRDLPGEGEGRSSEQDEPGQEFDLPATELSPALLAIEAEIRGIDLQEGRTGELQRAIYEKLAQNSYGTAGVVPQELTLCDMAKPVISKTEEKEGVTYYTLESQVEKCEHSPAAVGTVRIFAVGWKNGKIAKFVWGGPTRGARWSIDL